MQPTSKVAILIGFTILSVGIVLLLHPIAQDPAYHHFADQRTLWCIPNFVNVVSNLPFLVVGIAGFFRVGRTAAPAGIAGIYRLLFVGVFFTGLGSAWYHWHPDNDRLVWDRIPMTIVFMSLLVATFAELVCKRLAPWLLFPMVALGMGGVLYWHCTENLGHGDLRWYGWVQFYPTLAIPLLIGLYYSPSQRPAIRSLIWIVAWYAAAKVCEAADAPIYHTIGISGHTLKHLAAAVSTGYFVPLFARKYAIRQRAAR